MLLDMRPIVYHDFTMGLTADLLVLADQLLYKSFVFSLAWDRYG